MIDRERERERERETKREGEREGEKKRADSKKHFCKKAKIYPTLIIQSHDFVGKIFSYSEDLQSPA